MISNFNDIFSGPFDETVSGLGLQSLDFKFYHEANGAVKIVSSIDLGIFSSSDIDAFSDKLSSIFKQLEKDIGESRVFSQVFKERDDFKKYKNYFDVHYMLKHGSLF